MRLARTLRRLVNLRGEVVSPRARAIRSAQAVLQNFIAGRQALAGLGDSYFRARYVDVPAVLSDWFGPCASMEGATILDFGCGEGVTALSLALGFGPARVVGVDIMPDPERCLEVAGKNLGIEALPANLALHRVEPGKLHDDSERFDLAYSWSVFEHVDQQLIDHSLALVHAALRPGGFFLVQIAPLYYSSEGSHLFHVLREPWAHLRTQDNLLEHRLRAAVPDAAQADALWSTYRTLNRITHRDLVARIRRAGFETVRLFTTKDGAAPPPDLLEVFQRDILSTNQIVVLARRAV